MFAVSGDPADRCVDFEGDLKGVHLIGSGMNDGEIRVHGNAGRHLGSQMSGGTIRVEGDAGDWVGAEMRGGLIQVSGRRRRSCRCGLSREQAGYDRWHDPHRRRRRR